MTYILKVPRPSEMSSVAQKHLVMQLMGDIQRHPIAKTASIGEPFASDGYSSGRAYPRDVWSGAKADWRRNGSPDGIIGDSYDELKTVDLPASSGNDAINLQTLKEA